METASNNHLQKCDTCRQREFFFFFFLNHTDHSRYYFQHLVAAQLLVFNHLTTPVQRVLLLCDLNFFIFYLITLFKI